MTRRSRSLFDLRDALCTAEALSPKPPPSVERKVPDHQGVPLIAFGQDAPPHAPPPPPARVIVALPVEQSLAAPPDVSGLLGLMARLNALAEWVRSDSDVTRVLVIDDQGLPLIGSTNAAMGDTESLLAATGSVAHAMKRLALATPGTLSADFEGHVGESPVLQLIGCSAGEAFVVAIFRRQPFKPKDVDLLRSTFVRGLERADSGTSQTPKTASPTLRASSRSITPQGEGR